MTELTIVACITSDDVHDADSVPSYDEGNCRYWGAYEDSPIPDVRLFCVFNREPVDAAEAHAVASAYFA